MGTVLYGDTSTCVLVLVGILADDEAGVILLDSIGPDISETCLNLKVVGEAVEGAHANVKDSSFIPSQVLAYLYNYY